MVSHFEIPVLPTYAQVISWGFNPKFRVKSVGMQYNEFSTTNYGKNKYLDNTFVQWLFVLFSSVGLISLIKVHICFSID